MAKGVDAEKLGIRYKTILHVYFTLVFASEVNSTLRAL